MNGDARTNLATIHERLDHLTGVKAELPRLREKLGDDLFQFDKLEALVNELDAQVQSLESFSFTSLASSLKGNKQERLDALKEELVPLTQKYRTSIESLEALNEQVLTMERELEGFREVEKEYDRACDIAAEEIRSQGGEHASQLAEIDDHFQQIKAEHRAVTKAIEAAEQTEDHLNSMTHSLGSARSKMMYRSPLGAVGQLMHSTVTLQQTKGPSRLVRQGIERLKRHIDELSLEEDIEVNRELRKVSLSLAEMISQLSQNTPGGYFCDMSATLPIKQEVREALNHCSHLKKELTPQLEALEQQRRAIIESTI
jgi:chromosome segregation ATPase